MKLISKQYLKTITNSVLAGALFLNFGSSSLGEALQENFLDKLFISQPIESVIFNEPVRIAVIATAYSSTPDQTDDTPFITASGALVGDGIIAANFLPFGTKVKIPGLFGNKVFTVKDRMNRRYNKKVPLRIDIWVANRKDAIKFGIKEAEIIIFESDSLVETKSLPSA